MTSDSRLKVNNFDLLRIAAALQVLVGHGYTHLDLPSPAWWSVASAFPGVPIFFVISGFLISKSYERSTSVAIYARNRALRIYPALWACVLLTIAVASVAGFSFLRPQAAAWIPAQLVGLIYTPRFLDSFGFGSYNGSLWTIPIELQFYIALPVIYRLLRRRSRSLDPGLAGVFLLFTALAVAWASSSPPPVAGASESGLQKLVRYSFAPHIYLFLAGVLLQRWHAEQRRWIVGKGPHWVIVYLAVHDALPRNAWTEVAGTLVLAVCVMALAFTRPGLSHRLLRGNDLSYGVYIYHGLLINVFLLLGWRGNPALMPLLILSTLGVSLVSWKLIEQPCLGRKSKGPAPMASRIDAVTSTGEARRTPA